MARLDRLNARIGARRERLLGAAEVRALLARPTLAARLDALRATALGAGLPREPGAVPLGLVEDALRAGARAEALALLAQVEGEAAGALFTAFLGLEEAAAVKAIVRGVLQGAPVAATLAAAPATPGLDEGRLRASAAAASLEAALRGLEEGGSAVAAAVRAERAALERRELVALDAAADRAAFGRARRAARRHGEDAAVLARHLEDRVDARNALTALTLAGVRPAVDPFLPGGRRWSAAEAAGLAAAGPEGARAAIARAFGLGAEALATPWRAERALEEALLRPLRREARARPLSLAVPLFHLSARRAEVRRVCVVLRGAERGLPADELLALAEA